MGTRRTAFTLDDALADQAVLVLTRDEVIGVRSLVTVAEITTSARGLAAEVAIDHARVGLDRESVQQ